MAKVTARQRGGKPNFSACAFSAALFLVYCQAKK